MSNADNQTAVPLLVVGDARRAAVLACVRDCVQSWLRDWNASEASEFSLDLLPTRAAPNEIRIGESTWVAAGRELGATQLYVAVSEAGLSSVVGLPRYVSMVDGNSRNDNQGLAGNLIEKIVCSLAQSLLAQAHVKGEASSLPASFANELDQIVRRNRWWLVTVDLMPGTNSIVLAISPSLLQQLGPNAAIKFATAVDKRRAAIGEENVHVQAVLGEADISVGELASLVVNDVVVLRTAITQPAYLVTDAGRRIANVTVGRAGNKRAVAIAK